MAMYCYIKQEQTIRENKNKLNWIGRQLENIMPESEQTEQSPESKEPLNEPLTSKSSTEIPNITLPEPATENVIIADDEFKSTQLNLEPINNETAAATLTESSKESLKDENITKIPSNIDEIPIDESSHTTQKEEDEITNINDQKRDKSDENLDKEPTSK